MTYRYTRPQRGAPTLLLLGALLAGCAGSGSAPGVSGNADGLDAYLGRYRGSFADVETADPTDDVNYNVCAHGQERCLGDAPLADILLVLSRDADGRVRLGFLRPGIGGTADAPLDILGNGCGTTIGPLASVTRTKDTDGRSVVFPLDAANRLCLGKLRPTTDHEIRVTLALDAGGTRVADARLDRAVASANYLYVTENKVRRRVRIDLDNTLDTGASRRYRVCIEDAVGDFTRCVLTDRERKDVLLPVPVPGGIAASYTWWYDLVPDLERTHGLYRVEAYAGRFEQVEPGLTRR
jgi:hypothetical protein